MQNIRIVNNTGCDIRPYELEILASLAAIGALPVELADLFVAVPLEGINPDGTTRFRLDAA